MNYAISGHNQVPSCGNGWSYEELWPRLKNPVSSLLRAHVFGCPANVVDPALQDGHKIFKWDNCAQQGTFDGFSMEYSTSVPLVLNPVTGQIMPHSTMWCFMMPSPPLPLALNAGITVPERALLMTPEGGAVMVPHEHSPTSSEEAFAPASMVTPDSDSPSSLHPVQQAQQYTWKDGPASSWWYLCGKWEVISLLFLLHLALSPASSWREQPTQLINLGGSSVFLVSGIHHHLLKAKSSQNEAGNSSYSQANHSPDADKWWEVMETEMNTVEVDLKAWELMHSEPWMKVLPCMWALQLKQFPDDLFKQFKVPLCVCVVTVKLRG
ncbi:hypothetical protein ACHAW6_005377 [Cyclotella cf. meneghiniana]